MASLFSLSKALNQKVGTKFSINCKIVEKISGTEFLIADDSECLNLVVKVQKPTHMRYLEENSFLRIVHPGVDKADRTITIEQKTAIFLGKPIQDLVSTADNPTEPLVQAPEDFTPLSNSFGDNAYTVSYT
jgi:hypothetical protein